MDSAERMERLERAMAVFLAYQEASDPVSAGEFLQQHPDLREHLEMLLADAAASEAGALVPTCLEGHQLGDYRLDGEIGLFAFDSAAGDFSRRLDFETLLLENASTVFADISIHAR